MNKTVAMIRDARPGKKQVDLSIAVERLLNLSGGDRVSIDRKNVQQLTNINLPVRVVIASNGLTNLPDGCAVLPMRFITISFSQSFYGQEDIAVPDKLRQEWPGILARFVKGYHELLQKGELYELKSTAEACQEAQMLGQPLRAFLDDAFEPDPSSAISLDQIYIAYVGWHSLNDPGAKAFSKFRLRSEITRCGYSGLACTRSRNDEDRHWLVKGISTLAEFEDYFVKGRSHLGLNEPWDVENAF